MASSSASCLTATSSRLRARKAPETRPHSASHAEPEERRLEPWNLRNLGTRFTGSKGLFPSRDTLRAMTIAHDDHMHVFDEGPREEDLARCVHCGFCLQACPTYV